MAYTVYQAKIVAIDPVSLRKALSGDCAGRVSWAEDVDRRCVRCVDRSGSGRDGLGLHG